MKVAITGGTGFLGKEIINTLDKNGYTPVILTRNESFISKHEVRVTDYSNESLKISLNDVEAVIHLAARRGVSINVDDFLPNLIITQNLFDSCVDLEINNIVFASSIAVYSDSKTIPWTEENTHPKTIYATVKLACENIGNIYHNKFGHNIKSLRIAQILGEGEIKGMMNTFIDSAFDKSKIKVKGKSLARREYVYVKDVANAFLLALNKPNLHGTFNIGSNVAYTNLEIAEKINEVFENVGNLIYDDSDDESIESSLMDSSKSRKTLGYIPKWTFIDALLDIKTIKEEEKKL